MKCSIEGCKIPKEEGGEERREATHVQIEPENHNSFCKEHYTLKLKENSDQENYISISDYTQLESSGFHFSGQDSSSISEEQAKETDLKSKLVRLDANNKLEYGPALQKLESLDHFLFVPIVGAAETGKSTLANFLLAERDDLKAIVRPSTRDDYDVPTSSDYNAFVAGSLGVNGTVNPSIVVVDSEPYECQEVPFLSQQKKGSDRSNYTKLMSRLSYIFGDVMVYVTDDAKTATGNTWEALKEFTKFSDNKVVNLSRKPHLIVVHNKQTTADKIDNDQYVNLLDNASLYSSIQVVSIPEFRSFPKTCVERLNDFRDMVHTTLKQSFNQNKVEEFQSKTKITNLSQVIPLLTRDAIIDMSKFKTFRDNRICNGLAQTLRLFIKTDKKVVEAKQFTEAIKKINNIVHLAIHQNKTKDFGEIVEQLKEFIGTNYAPCTTDVGGGTRKCILNKRSHNSTGTSQHKFNDDNYEDGQYENNLNWQTLLTTQPTQTKVELQQIIKKSILLYKDKVPSHDICFGCLINFPSKLLTCGHFCCLFCQKECCDDPQPKSVSEEMSNGSGYRVLSLDGGGVRGVMPCIILDRIQTQLYTIPIPKLFDLIVGTSTGGLLALGLSLPQDSADSLLTPKEMKEKFVLLSKDVFGIGYLTMGANMYKYKARYDAGELKKILLPFISDSQYLLKSKSQTRIATVTAPTEPGKVCLLPSYNIEDIPRNENLLQDEWRREYIKSGTPMDAALATSAAPSYFRAHTIGDNPAQYMDGGLHSNNPCEIALSEGKRIWGKEKKCDFLLSLGTGSADSIVSYSTSGVVQYFMNSCTNNSRSWSQMMDYLSDDHYTTSIRINPKLASPIGLEEHDKIEQVIKETNEAIENSLTSRKDPIPNGIQDKIDKISNRILSTLFYAEFTQEAGGILKLTIKSRFALPSKLVEKINKDSFKLECSSKRSKRSTIEEINSTKDFPFTGKVNKNPTTGENQHVEIVGGLSLTSLPKKLNITCHIECYRVDNRTNGELISGCPYKLPTNNNHSYQNNHSTINSPPSSSSVVSTPPLSAMI
ncbi:patatin family protein [Cavenderia fasciculata]|uniref:Patatin family protein n=1 Tax=Cavenderia fasciculata TaxID=261658 RepID=F4QEX0_CACFS|nr:patatin family protein [Cavenderia fasciculata]EGG14177.1 patatin family protein [Cavenderia fasciculata]|eukprot:XP_004350885.1 patatin family protein [Cavenderia fasciculata]